jgi:predicted AlkP superfamily pyrophosphatase or phosphodiesterase
VTKGTCCLTPTVTGRSLDKVLDSSAARPRAILLVVLDGMRRDYFDRHREILPTLTRLRRDGAWFGNAGLNFFPTKGSLTGNGERRLT